MKRLSIRAPVERVEWRSLCDLAADALHFATHLRETEHEPDPGILRKGMIAALNRFRSEAARRGVPCNAVEQASYALCTLLDETVAGTSWGAGRWAATSLLMHFHGERSGGERVFAMLDAIQRTPLRDAELAELFYVCLALGLQGRYRIHPEGAGKLDRRRDHLYRLLGDIAPSSAQASGSAKAWRRIASAVVVIGVTAFLATLYVVLSLRLGARLDALKMRVAAIGAPRASEASAFVHDIGIRTRSIEHALADDVAAGMLTLDRLENGWRIRIAVRDLFAPGSASVALRHEVMLRRTGRALADWPGTVRIVGHSDTSPLAGGAAANRRLSLRRAESVRALLAAAPLVPASMRAEGRGADDPLYPNDSADRRAANRRVDIFLTADPVPDSAP
ncbi:type VI secretion system protein ImpK [Luteibacter rhizovicinus]|uniref:Type VI secretion system protein ImpK n=1 Tax=Luteibacter rhizovicinus TaxID=242606 RepID=A0A4R3Z0G1_9GAMM|nr:type IVB secretion system protein IcmH/DotU [Luteibacter rhizovicinus]TCV97304.1 type VI secretion system protein ImpK [Luteibacter rhizovicinus]